MRVLAFSIVVLTCLAVGSTAAAADYEAGRRAFESGDLDAAKAAWRKAVADGDRRAQHDLGRLLLSVGDMEGWRLLEKSAAARYLPAEYRMARLALASMFIKTDLKGVVRRYEKVLRHTQEEKRAHPIETADAQWSICNFYLFGIAVPANPKRGMALLRAAADAGHPLAQSYLGTMLGGRFSGLGAKPDLAEAHKYFVLCWKQETGEEYGGDRGQLARRHALDLRKRMSPSQLTRSRALVRRWLAAKDAGTLGRAFNAVKRWSDAEKGIRRNERMRSEINRKVIETLQAKPCEQYWLRSHAPVEGTKPGGERWVEAWTVDVCGHPAVAHGELRLEGQDVRWKVTKPSE